MTKSSLILNFLLTLLPASSTLAESQPAADGNSLSIDGSRTEITYNPMIFGQFIEHFDNQVYGGIFDPGNPLSDADGFRTDVMQAIRDIHTPIVRWPGGCFVSTYHWVGGVGAERTPAYDKAWQVEDPNTFGTDEYITWCRKIGAEPFICTNAGTGTPEEMSDWVEYCNLSIGKWGRMRMANGHTEPYNVKYWSIGNENWGGHELGAKTVDEWGPLVCESAKLMRSVCPTLKLFAAATSNKAWTLPLLKAAGKHIDYVSIHGYWDPLFHVNNPSSYIQCMMRTEKPEQDILNTIGILDEAGFGGGKIKIAYDEWNLRNWHHPWHGNFRRGFDIAARRKNDIASTYTMADALFSACFLNACLRHSDIVQMACFSPIVNTRGAIFVHPKGIVRRTTYWTFHMFTNLLEKQMVPIRLNASPLTDGKSSTPVLDAVLTSNPEHTHYVLAVVNKDPEHSQPLTIDFQALGIKAKTKLQATVLSGRTVDDYNDIGAENRVVPHEETLAVKASSIMLPAHSLSMIVIEKTSK